LTENREALRRTVSISSSKEKIEEEIAYYLEKAKWVNDIYVHVLKYWYNYPKKMPHLANLARHIFCIPTTSEYTAGDFINPVKSLLDCPDAENLFFSRINYFQLKPSISSWQLDNVDCVSSSDSDSEPGNSHIRF
jgi:hypothetical protein